MKLKTKLYTDAVKEALLSLSDIEFYNTIHYWLERISKNYWEWWQFGTDAIARGGGRFI